MQIVERDILVTECSIVSVLDSNMMWKRCVHDQTSAMTGRNTGRL